MNEDRIRRLLEIFRESGVDEMEYQESFWRGTRVRLGRHRSGDPLVLQSPPPAPDAAPPPQVPSPARPEAASPPAAAEADGDDGLHVVRAPMVGTFYRSSSPESDAFVQPGDRVRAGQTLCIIEAMKIMNEIQAEVAGEVISIDAEAGGPVEYNQPLVHIRPT